MRAAFVRAVGKEAGESRIWAEIHYGAVSATCSCRCRCTFVERSDSHQLIIPANSVTGDERAATWSACRVEQDEAYT